VREIFYVNFLACRTRALGRWAMYWQNETGCSGGRDVGNVFYKSFLAFLEKLL
jgi:hypothetical protein